MYNLRVVSRHLWMQTVLQCFTQSSHRVPAWAAQDVYRFSSTTVHATVHANCIWNHSTCETATVVKLCSVLKHLWNTRKQVNCLSGLFFPPLSCKNAGFIVTQEHFFLWRSYAAKFLNTTRTTQLKFWRPKNSQKHHHLELHSKNIVDKRHDVVGLHPLHLNQMIVVHLIMIHPIGRLSTNQCFHQTIRSRWIIQDLLKRLQWGTRHVTEIKNNTTKGPPQHCCVDSHRRLRTGTHSKNKIWASLP